jgi:hypothetical protein
LQAVQRQQQRRLTALIRRPEQVVGVGIPERVGFGDHALVMIAGAAVQLAAIEDLERDTPIASSRYQGLQAVRAIGDQQAADRAGTAKRLAHGVAAIEQVHRLLG